MITNFKPGTMEGWGLGYADAAARNERIIYAMGSSFGPEGPDAAREGADLSAQAAGGLISTTGGDGSDPSCDRCHHRRPHRRAEPAGRHLGRALRAGAHRAGQLVETSLLGGQIWAQAGEYTRYLMSGEIRVRAAEATR